MSETNKLLLDDKFNIFLKIIYIKYYDYFKNFSEIYPFNLNNIKYLDNNTESLNYFQSVFLFDILTASKYFCYYYNENNYLINMLNYCIEKNTLKLSCFHDNLDLEYLENNYTSEFIFYHFLIKNENNLINIARDCYNYLNNYINLNDLKELYNLEYNF